MGEKAQVSSKTLSAFGECTSIYILQNDRSLQGRSLELAGPALKQRRMSTASPEVMHAALQVLSISVEGS